MFFGELDFVVVKIVVFVVLVFFLVIGFVVLWYVCFEMVYVVSELIGEGIVL